MNAIEQRRFLRAGTAPVFRAKEQPQPKRGTVSVLQTDRFFTKEASDRFIDYVLEQGYVCRREREMRTPGKMWRVEVLQLS